MKLFRNLMAAAGIALSMLAVASFSLIAPAMAQAVPAGSRSFQAREFQTQQTHYLRFTLNFNSCVVPAGAATCNIKVGAVPYNSFLTGINYQLITTFNPTTSATWSLGTNTTGTNILAAQNVFTGQATTEVSLIASNAFAGQGELVTGAGATQTGRGGFDIYAVYTTGANGSQGTQGVVVFIISYIAPNDGTCIAVPLATTGIAC
jgi:hypothetical protein